MARTITSLERLPVSIQTLHAELADRAWTGSFREIMDAGGSAHVKTVKGRKYWYWQSLTRNGARPPARYLGPDKPVLRRRIRERTGVADARKERVNMVRSLRAGRIPGPDALSGNVLAALSEAGAFRLRAVVVGSLAFQCYVPMLGFMTPGAVSRTGDVDVGQIPAILIAVQNRIEPDLLSVLKTADSRFEAVPSPFDPRSILRYAIRDGSQERFAVDILAPLRGPPRDRPVHLPALGGDAQPLRFLDFLMHQEIKAVGLHGPGIPVKAPAPERFAVHKLPGASRCRPDASGPDKARKDLAQADILCRVLVRDRPDDLIDAWNEFRDRGPAWRAAVAQSWKMLPDKVKEVLPSPDVPGTAAKPSGNVDESPSL